MEKFKRQLFNERYRELWRRVQEDSRYGELVWDAAQLEPEFQTAVSKLSPEEQALIREYVGLFEDMTRVALAVAVEGELFDGE